MRSITFTELRNRASEIFDDVEEGETIEVARHGKRIAKIIPASGEPSTPSWKREGLQLSTKGFSLSEAILEERKHSR